MYTGKQINKQIDTQIKPEAGKYYALPTTGSCQEETTYQLPGLNLNKGYKSKDLQTAV